MEKTNTGRNFTNAEEQKVVEKFSTILSNMFLNSDKELSNLFTIFEEKINKNQIKYTGEKEEVIKEYINSLISLTQKFVHDICDDFEIMSILIDKGVDINKNTNYILDTIISSGNIQCIQMFIDKGIDLTKNNNIALKLAVKYGKTDIVKILLDNGADINSDDEYPIILALKNRNPEMVQLLIEKGADVTVNDNMPIKMATEYGYTDIVETCLKQNEVHMDINELLIIAVKKGNVPSIRFLLNKGADPMTNNGEFICYLIGKRYFHILADLCTVRDDIKFDYESHIMRESKIYGNECNVINIIKCMKDKHEINRFFYQLIDSKDYTILKDLCAIHGQIVRKNKSVVSDTCRKGDYYLLTILYDYGFDITTNNYQAFIDAAAYNQTEIVNFYIQKGTDIHLRDDLALRTAVTRNAYEVIRLLIKEGANMYANDDEILNDIIKNDKLTTLIILLDNGFKINVTDDDFDNPIDNIIISGKINIIKELLHRGITINHNDRAIKMAASENKSDILKVLFENGANVDAFSVRDVVNLTASGKLDAVKVIKEYKKNKK